MSGSAVEDLTIAGADELSALIERRAGRAIKAILRVKEEIADPHLSPGQRSELRKVVLDEVNDLADTAKELLAIFAARAGEGVVVNALYLQKLDELHQAVVHDGG